MKLLKELTVLYVDDEVSACESLQHILKYYFSKVFIAHNGKEALEIYTKEQCHLLIVDYDMPIMNGYEFLSKVREKDDKISSIIISSYDDKEKLKNAIKLNLLEYLVKPYELNELKSILKSFAKKIEGQEVLKYNITKTCYYDINKKLIIENDMVYKLTAFEVKIFEYLLEYENQIIVYGELLDILESNNQKSLISMVHKINKKLPIKLIENIKDIGYKLSR